MFHARNADTGASLMAAVSGIMTVANLLSV